MTDTSAPAGAPMTAEAARSEIASITSGSNSDMARAYLAKEPAAVHYMNALHQRATSDAQEGQPSAPQGQRQQPATTDTGPLYPDDGKGALPLRFAADAPVAQMAEMSRLATESIKTLGVPSDIGRANIKILEDAIAARGSKPVAMTPVELNKMEHLLGQRWGADYEANMDRIEAAMRKAGKGGEWLRLSVLHAGPMAAVAVLDALARGYD